LQQRSYEDIIIQQAMWWVVVEVADAAQVEKDFSDTIA
jgi:hypothetical protein